jgi:hypothetical protein
MKRRNRDGAERAPGKAAEDGEFGERYPCLYAHLTDEKWDDGARRLTSTLFFFCEGGYFKVCLNDRAEKQVAFVSGLSWAECLDTLERDLEADLLEWRKQKKRSGE